MPKRKLLRPCAIGLAIVWAIPWLSACQSTADCPLAEASAKGRKAALADQDKKSLIQDAQANVCALADPAWKQAWESGWQEGFGQLCQGSSGWQMGWEQQPAWQICQQDSNRFGSYLSAYRLARQIREMEDEVGSLRAQADEQQVTVEGSPFTLSTGLDKVQSARLRQLELDLVDLRVLAEQQGWMAESAPVPAAAEGAPQEGG